LKDIASGLNTQREGLLRLFKLVEGRSVDVILITYEDRLTRFGFECIEEFFSTMGVRIEAAFGEEPKNGTQELVEDLISNVTSFSGKIYGVRSHKKTLLVQGVKKLIGELSGEGSEVKGKSRLQDLPEVEGGRGGVQRGSYGRNELWAVEQNYLLTPGSRLGFTGLKGRSTRDYPAQGAKG